MQGEGTRDEGMDEGWRDEDTGIRGFRDAGTWIKGVRRLWPHPHPSGPALQVQARVGPPSSAPLALAVPPPRPPTHRGGGSGTSARFSLSQRCSAGAQRDPRVSPSPPRPHPVPPGTSTPQEPLAHPPPTGTPPPRDPILHPGDPEPSHPPRQGSPKPSWGVLQPLRGVPSPLSSPRGSLCPIPPRTHQFLHVDQPVQEGLAAFVQEGQIWGTGGVIGGSPGMSEGPQPRVGQLLSPPSPLRMSGTKGMRGGFILASTSR